MPQPVSSCCPSCSFELASGTLVCCGKVLSTLAEAAKHITSKTACTPTKIAVDTTDQANERRKHNRVCIAGERAAKTTVADECIIESAINKVCTACW